MAWIQLNATDPPPPDGCANVHFRKAAGHEGTFADPIPTSAFVRGDKATFLIGIGTGVTGVTAADDVTNHLPIRRPGTPVELVATVKAAHAADLVFDVQVSADNGTTWSSILVTTLTVPSGSVVPVSRTVFAAVTFAVGDLLRIDLKSGTALDVALVLVWS